MKWNKVSDGLPEKGKEVMVVCDYHNLRFLSLACYGVDKEWKYTHDGKRVEDTCPVTHWASAPKLPRN